MNENEKTLQDVQNQEELYVVSLKIKSKVYYMVDLKWTLSQRKSDAMIFKDKDIALLSATQIETMFSNVNGLGITVPVIFDQVLDMAF